MKISVLIKFVKAILLIYLHVVKPAQGYFSIIAPTDSIIASVGEDIILPCQIIPAFHARTMEVRWFKQEPNKYIYIQFYKSGQSYMEKRGKMYINRVEKFQEEILNGNVSLKLMNIQLSDRGNYICSVQSGDEERNELINLEVVALGSKPFISIEEHKTGELRLTCTSEGWFPKPEVLWIDWNGDALSEQHETISELDDEGQFTIQSYIHVDKRTLNGLSCVVRNNLLKKEQRSTPPKSDSFIGSPLTQTVIAVLGKEVLLPCLFTVKAYPRSLEVSWVKTNFENEIQVHSFTDRQTTAELQGENYRSRTKLFKEEFNVGNFSLKLTNVQLSDSGNYLCSVKSGKGEKHTLIQVYIASLGTDPFLSIISYQEDELKLVCKSQKWFPQPEVSWYGEDGQNFTNYSEMKFEQDEGGLYQVESFITLPKNSIYGLSCSIRNTLLTEGKDATPPTPDSFVVIGPSEPIFALIGEEVLLPCLVTINYNNLQNLEVTWIKTEFQNTIEVHTFRDGENLVDHQDQNYRHRTKLFTEEFAQGNASLKLTNFQVTDSGNYTCSVRSEHGVKDALIQVNTVGIGPKPFISIADFQDDEIKLVCESKDWDSKPEVSWTDEDGQDISAVSKTIIEENEKHQFKVKSYFTLRRNSINPILCNIGNTMGKDTNIPKQDDIAVLGPQNSIFGVIGEDVWLPCLFIAKTSPQSLEVIWIKTEFRFQNAIEVHSFRDGHKPAEQVGQNYRNRTKLFTEEFDYGNASLKLSNIQLLDSGNYTCSVKSEHGMRGAQIQLKVAGVGTEPSLNIASYQDNRIRIICKSKDWFPEPEVVWAAEKGQKLSPHSTTNAECDENGLFKVESFITVTKNSIKNLTCMVKSIWVNHWKSNSIPVPDNFLVVRHSGPITAITGEDIILPCQLEPKLAPSNMKLQWLKAEPDYQVTVLYYEKGCNESPTCNEGYNNRILVFEEELKNGNVSLKLLNIKISDQGNYICSVRSGKISKSVTIGVQVTDGTKKEHKVHPPHTKEVEDNETEEGTPKDHQVHPPHTKEDEDSAEKKGVSSNDSVEQYDFFYLHVFIIIVICTVIFRLACRRGRSKNDLCLEEKKKKGDEKLKTDSAADTETDTAEQEKKNLEAEQERKKLETDTVEQEKNNLETEIESLRDQKDTVEQEKKTLETDTVEEEKNNLEKEIKTLRDEKEQEKKVLETEIKTLHEQKEIKTLHDQKAEHEKKKKMEADAAEQKKKKLETEIQTLHDQKEQEKKELEAEIKTLHNRKEQEKKKLETEIKTLHDQKEQEKKKLEAEIQKLHDQTEQEKKKKLETEQEKKKLEAELEKRKKLETEQEKKKLEAEIQKLHDQTEQEKKKLEAEIQTLHDQTEQGKKKKLETEQEKKKLEAEIQRLHDQSEQEKKKLEAEIQRLHDQSEQEKKKLEAEIQRLHDQSEQEKKKLEAEIQRLHDQSVAITVEQKPAIDQEAQRLQKWKADAEEEKHNLQTENQRLQNELEKVKSSLERETKKLQTDHEKVKSNLEREIKKLQTEHERKKENLKAVELEKRKLKEENQKLKTGHETEKENLKAEIKKLQTDHENEKQKLKVVELEKENLKAENHKLKTEYETEKENLKAEIKKLQTDQEKEKQKSKVVELEKENLKAENQRLENELEKEKNNQERVQEKRKLETEIKRLQEQKEKGEMDLEAVHQKLLKETEEQNSLEAEIQRLRKQHEKEKKDLESEIQRVREQHENEKKELNAELQRVREQQEKKKKDLEAEEQKNLDAEMQKLREQHEKKKKDLEAEIQRVTEEHGTQTVQDNKAIWLYAHAAKVVLDPNIAHPKLRVEGNVVRYDEKWQPVSDNPKRFDSCLYILASEGFNSGKHYWEVKVEDKPDWDLGVAKKSIETKGKLILSPEKGFWTIGLCNGNDCWARSEPWKRLQFDPKTSKIGVFLDYENGLVSFYNADSMSHIYSFNHTFTEALYPFFNLSLSVGGKNTSPLVVSSQMDVLQNIKCKIVDKEPIEI